jgi:choline dehydrogenase-like flavoprotein
MQDKYGALVGPFTSAKGTSFLRERDINTKTTAEWLLYGTGPYQSCRTEATFTVSSSYAKKDGSAWLPDMHSYFLAYSVDERYEQNFRQSFNFKPEILQNYFGSVKGQDSFLQLVTVNRPTGTGTLRLKNKDPFVKPLLDPKYLQHPRDIAVLVEGTKIQDHFLKGYHK